MCGDVNPHSYIFDLMSQHFIECMLRITPSWHNAMSTPLHRAVARAIDAHPTDAHGWFALVLATLVRDPDYSDREMISVLAMLCESLAWPQTSAICTVDAEDKPIVLLNRCLLTPALTALGRAFDELLTAIELGSKATVQSLVRKKKLKTAAKLMASIEHQVNANELIKHEWATAVAFGRLNVRRALTQIEGTPAYGTKSAEYQKLLALLAGPAREYANISFEEALDFAGYTITV